MSKETKNNLEEEHFLRTARGRLSTVFLGIAIAAGGIEISNSLKPEPYTEVYDFSQEPTIVRLSDEEMKRFFVTPKPIPDINLQKELEHVVPEEIEKQLAGDMPQTDN